MLIAVLFVVTTVAQASGRYNFDGNTPANDWYWQFSPDQWLLAEVSI